MCSYLNSDRAVYAFRRSVPEHLRPYFRTATGKPRTEWRFSLGTKDRAEAKTRCHRKAVETDNAIREAQALFDDGKPPALIPSTNAEEERFEADLHDMRARELQSFYEDCAVQDRERDRETILNRLRGPRDQLSRAEAALRDLIPDEEFGSPEIKQRRATARQADWDQGALQSSGYVKALLVGLPSHPSITSLFQGYANDAGLKPATIKRWQAVIRDFVAHLGHDDATKVDAESVRSWRRGLSDGGRENGALSPRTIKDVYLAAVKATFSWALEEGRITANPITTVKVRVPKPPKLRGKSLTPAEAKMILSATLSGSGSKISTHHALARRWVPWLCAYTGARVGEIAQLRGRDVTLVGAIWTLRITPEAGSQKGNEARMVPLHSHLVEQGFPAVAKAAADAPIFYNPALSRGGSAANPHSKKVGERLAKWVREVGVTDPNVQPNHGWRHLFKTLGRTHGMKEEARDAFPGHADGTEGRSYGEREMPYLSAQLEKIPRFET
ncbi:DUF6538 domain-containing protein [Brevundimonas sp. NIBR11]|uniref:DUF6538 domain-containing protein n=1 Tax=Brevundimonas sp. NIBR11 TaxID=3015999 RepID=UPI0022F00FDE|nr:DUF6538 domain-containing protein [Brevundimonas sp. NIBR11]WGM30616.1 Tyrosine recombinase XerC [Brevundimonas sp. NIBR11]